MLIQVCKIFLLSTSKVYIDQEDIYCYIHILINSNGPPLVFFFLCLDSEISCSLTYFEQVHHEY